MGGRAKVCARDLCIIPLFNGPKGGSVKEVSDQRQDTNYMGMNATEIIPRTSPAVL